MRHQPSYGDSALLRLATLILLATVILLCLPQRAFGGGGARSTFDVAQVATQLGVMLPGKESGEIPVGVAVTGYAEEPAKLAALGMPGFHKGARVMIMRIATDRLLVEADELDPTPRRATAKVLVALDGRLTTG